MEATKIAAIVLAAGKGRRMQSDVAKQYMMLKEKPVLYYALKAFEDSEVDEIVLVTAEEEREYCRQNIVERYGFSKVSHIVAGGAERYHSVYNGLCALWNCAYVLVHDGARPFVTQQIIHRSLEEVRTRQAVAVGMPVKDTIKIIDETGFVKETPDRQFVWAIQTPQTFSYTLIRQCYEKLIQEDKQQANAQKITDDAMVVELFTGVKVKLVEGSYDNIKITTPEDVSVAEAFLQD
jgi:2-C-methyl-D-erythritol 4-phosphate cytidylyltransferase